MLQQTQSHEALDAKLDPGLVWPMREAAKIEAPSRMAPAAVVGL